MAGAAISNISHHYIQGEMGGQAKQGINADFTRPGEKTDHLDHRFLKHGQHICEVQRLQVIAFFIDITFQVHQAGMIR